MVSTAFATASQTNTLVLTVAFTLLLPALPFALYRLVPLLRHRRSSLQTAQDATLAVVTAVALALYAIPAFVALSGTGSWTVAVASGAFGCLSVTLSESPVALAQQPCPTARIERVAFSILGLIRITLLLTGNLTLLLSIARPPTILLGSVRRDRRATACRRVCLCSCAFFLVVGTLPRLFFASRA